MRKWNSNLFIYSEEIFLIKNSVCEKCSALKFQIMFALPYVKSWDKFEFTHSPAYKNNKRKSSTQLEMYSRKN